MHIQIVQRDPFATLRLQDCTGKLGIAVNLICCATSVRKCNYPETFSVLVVSSDLQVAALQVAQGCMLITRAECPPNDSGWVLLMSTCVKTLCACLAVGSGFRSGRTVFCSTRLSQTHRLRPDHFALKRSCQGCTATAIGMTPRDLLSYQLYCTPTTAC